MKNLRPLPVAAVRRRAIKERLFVAGCLALLLSVVGCGSGAAPPAPQQTSQPAPPATYLAPLVGGTTNSGVSLFNPPIYSFDDVANTFTESTYALDSQQQGKQIQFAGVTTAASRGLLELGFTAEYNYNSDTGLWVATDFPVPPATQLPAGGFAVELTGQAGALVQLTGQPAAPLVPTATCPSIATAQSFNFLTIPTSFFTSTNVSGWSPTTDTAYGSVDVTAKAGAVNLSNIQQFTFPSGSGSGVAPMNPSPSSVVASCGQTAYGNTISIPGQVVVVNPGEFAKTPPQAIANIGPTGLLVEDNGLFQESGVQTFATYQNALGAGVGAVGLPVPASALNTGTLVGAQYLGFVYGSGIPTVNSPNTGLSSHLTSFGFSTLPSSCASVAASTNTLIYGGDFSQDNPSSSQDGFGQCDLALDLGPQDAGNGLYSHATVWMGASYAGNATNVTYSFPAVAVAGQLNGKSTIFVLGVDSSQAWEIYLLQSN